MTSSTSLLRLNMLSQLSLTENAFIAAFLAECHQYLPSLSNSYCWLCKNQPSDIYDELHQHALSNAISSHIKNFPDLDLQCLITEDHILTSHKSWLHHFLSKSYRKTFLHYGYHQSLILPVKRAGVVSSLLIFNRDRKDKAFNSKTINQARAIRDILELGLQHAGKSRTRSAVGWRSGLIIVDQRGELSQCCPEGHNILALALQRKPGNLQRTSFSDVRNLPGVLQMIDKLLDSGTPVSNAKLIVSSLWGDFLINGFPLIDQGGKRAPQVYLNLSWQVPFSLMLFLNIRFLCFTPRQEMIALLYATGESTKCIANKLDLSLYTVKEHVQHIFEKLQVHTRAELIEHIICQGSETSDDQLQQGQLNRTERSAMNFSGS